MAGVFSNTKTTKTSGGVFKDYKAPIEPPKAKAVMNKYDKPIGPVAPKMNETFDDGKVGGVDVAYNLLPISNKDKPLAKLGKGVVNYGAGVVGRTLSAPGQLLMNVADNTSRAIEKRPLNIGEKSFVGDILPSGASKAIGNIKSPVLKSFITSGIETLADPTTYIGGGILDDLAKAGRFGKAGKLGTTENLINVGNRNLKNTKTIPKQTAKETVEELSTPKKGEVIRQGTQSYTFNKLNKDGSYNVIDEDGLKWDIDAPKQKTTNKQDGGMMSAALGSEPTPNGIEIFDTKQKGSGTLRQDPLIPEGKKERGFSANTRTDLNNPDNIRDDFTENPLTYEQISNKDTLTKAEEIMSKGQAAATSELYKSISGKDFKPETVPLAKMLAREAAEKGDVQTARVILSDMAEKLTEAGQFTQAAKILREADPETFLMSMDKNFKKLNEQGAKQYGKKWVDVDLTPDEIEGINNIPRGNQQAYEAMWEKIGNRISQQLPSSGLEKFDSWRRISMLLNPKTHIRNVAGNVIMSAAAKVADTISAGIQKVALKKANRTSSIGWTKNKALKDTVENTWSEVKKEITGNTRWDNEIGNLKALGKDKRIFKNNALNAIDKFSKDTLAFEDNIFTERAYKDALGSYMNAKGINEVTDAAKNYAKRRAYEVTFKQDNAFASFIQKQKSKGGVGGKLLDAALPFVKTPSNIVVNAIEYSPAGFIKAVVSAKNGEGAAKVIEDISKGLTGTGVSGLGYYLASKGLIRSEKTNSANAEGLLKESGNQPYSFKVPYLDGTFTYDWAQPIAVPFAMGVEVFNSLAKNEDADMDAITDAIASGGDTIFNMSMLQSVKRLMGGGFGSATENIMSLPVSYLTQAVPTVLGQTSKTVDDVQRSTYDTTKLGILKRQIQSKIPFASKGLEPKLDIWGNEQKQGGAFQQFILPGYYSKDTKDNVTKEVKRLYDSTGETSFLPKLAKGNFTNKGKRVELKPNQLTQFQKQMGQENYKKLNNLINSPLYKNSNDAKKAKLVQKITETSYDNAKEKILGIQK